MTKNDPKLWSHAHFLMVFFHPQDRGGHLCEKKLQFSQNITSLSQMALVLFQEYLLFNEGYSNIVCVAYPLINVHNNMSSPVSAFVTCPNPDPNPSFQTPKLSQIMIQIQDISNILKTINPQIHSDLNGMQICKLQVKEFSHNFDVSQPNLIWKLLQILQVELRLSKKDGIVEYDSNINIRIVGERMKIQFPVTTIHDCKPIKILNQWAFFYLIDLDLFETRRPRDKKLNPREDVVSYHSCLAEKSWFFDMRSSLCSTQVDPTSK